MLYTHERVVRGADADELVELDLDGRAVAVLRVLDQKDHQERDDRRSGVDHQLPRVAVFKNRASDGPDDDDAESEDERRRTPRSPRCPVGDVPEDFGEPASSRASFFRFFHDSPIYNNVLLKAPVTRNVDDRPGSRKFSPLGLAAISITFNAAQTL